MGKKGSADNIYGISEKRGKSAFWGFSGETETPETGFRHSNYYHKYFRGYTEVRNEKPNGKYSTQRIYTAPWIVQDLSGARFVLLRILYFVLAFGSGAIYFTAMSVRVPGNSSWYVAIPGLPTIGVLFFLAACLVAYLVRPRKMTLWDHSSGSKRLKAAALCTALIQLATALAKIIFILIEPKTHVITELLCTAGVVCSACAAYLIYHVEKRVKYREEENHVILPEGEKHEIW